MLAERFKSVKNRAAFAREHNLRGGGTMIYQHISGIRPIGLDAAKVYAKAFGCSLEEISSRLARESIEAANLTGGRVKTSTELDLLNNPEYPAIRRVDLRLVAGMTGFSVEYEDGEGDMIVFKRRWYDMHGYKPERLIAIRVQGSSMETGLNQNDTVVINTEDTNPKDGEVFAVNYEGAAVIKRLVRDRGEWWLSSDNPDQRKYPPKIGRAHV